jgi:hypothetical protein
MKEMAWEGNNQQNYASQSTNQGNMMLFMVTGFKMKKCKQHPTPHSHSHSHAHSHSHPNHPHPHPPQSRRQDVPQLPLLLS